MLTSETPIDQKRAIMQNKPNLPDAQMNVNTVITKNYENDNTFRLPENKPNTKPIQTQFPKSQKWTKTYLPQRFMKKNADRGYEKTKPKQTQSNPISKAKNAAAYDD